MELELKDIELQLNVKELSIWFSTPMGVLLTLFCFAGNGV